MKNFRNLKIFLFLTVTIQSGDRSTVNRMNVPAWKRLGLKVKAVVGNDPLALVPRDETVEKKNEETSSKTINKKKRKTDQDIDESKNNKEKKPPKRVKVPKSERAENNTVIKDQLKYMREFNIDRGNWKFSKQKQNWIIKNIRTIPDDYENDMFVYLNSVQGGSKDRIINDMKSVVDDWNKMVLEAEEQMKKDLEETKDETDEEKTEEKDSKKVKDKKKSEKSEKCKKSEKSGKVVVDYDYAVRARAVYKALTEEDLPMQGVEEEDNEDEESKEEQGKPEVKLIEETVDVEK